MVRGGGGDGATAAKLVPDEKSGRRPAARSPCRCGLAQMILDLPRARARLGGRPILRRHGARGAAAPRRAVLWRAAPKPWSAPGRPQAGGAVHVRRRARARLVGPRAARARGAARGSGAGPGRRGRWWRARRRWWCRTGVARVERPTVSFWMYLLEDSASSHRTILQAASREDMTPVGSRCRAPAAPRADRLSAAPARARRRASTRRRCPLRRWTHVAVVLKGGAALTLFVNGVKDCPVLGSSKHGAGCLPAGATYAWEEGDVLHNEGPLYVGADPYMAGTPMFLDTLDPRARAPRARDRRRSGRRARAGGALLHRPRLRQARRSR